jgi:putative endonuclease
MEGDAPAASAPCAAAEASTPLSPTRSCWVYILASQAWGALYIGVTNGIIFRVEQHREGKGPSFSRKYKVHMLVWYQEFGNIREAIQREKIMEEWRREWKVNLIERTNPHWEDLYPSLPGVKPVLL